jgi:hypothetical protein
MMSLRFMSDPPPPEPPSLEARAERILNQAATPQQQAPAREGRPMINIDHLHTPADVDNRIEALKRDGIEQITDRAQLKRMKPEEIAQARRDGRLLRLLNPLPEG